MKNNIIDLKDKFIKIFLKFKYKNKSRRFNISDEMLGALIERVNSKEVIEILNIINNSESKEEFKNNIIEFCKKSKSIYIGYLFLLGNVIGNYSFFDNVNTNPYSNSFYNYDNFNEDNYDIVLKVLREAFCKYLYNNNALKNKFLIDETENYNYTLDLDEELCLKIYDDFVEGKRSFDGYKYLECYSIVRKYISNLIGIYGRDILEKELDFVFYDLNNKKDLSLEERRKRYFELSQLSDKQKNKINNLNNLINKLKTINNDVSKNLINRINKIDNKTENISEIEDIYMEYEILLREDLLSKLYIPSENYVVIDDYKDLKPQLLHMFIRDVEKHRVVVENKIIEDIIRKRKDKNNVSTVLDEKEQKEYEERMNLGNAMFNPTIVNYSFDGRDLFYSDRNGFASYHSDTSNQISASVYSENYYLNHFSPWWIGVGFNKESVVPEAIAISSSCYLTTNMGLNNLEYDESYEFNLMSSTYSELKDNDGKSEVILFRRNIDYDTKGAYLFVTIDSSDRKRSEEFIDKAKKMVEKSKLKLVIYDLYKIKKVMKKAW